MSNKKRPITTDLAENETAFRNMFSGCDDVKYRKMKIGKHLKITCLIAYIEVSLNNTMLEKSALGRLIAYLEELPENEINYALKENAVGLSDAVPIKTLEDAALLLLTGSAILFVDGYPEALKISDKGYPGLDVGESDTEKVVRGSDESFTESEKINTALIRKRIRSTRLKVKEFQVGLRSHTNVALVYIEDLADKKLIEETHRRLNSYEIDGVLDSGVMEQLAEDKWYSPFPQFHSTRRPDRAAMSVLEGKVVVIVDNSPVALLLPADLNSFLWLLRNTTLNLTTF